MLLMICITFANIAVFALIQRQAPTQHLGKISALVITIANLVSPIGQYAFGLLMELFIGGVYTLFIALAILTIGVAAVANKMFKTA
jgi:MFS family permease